MRAKFLLLVVMAVSPAYSLAKTESVLENVLVTGAYSPQVKLTSSVSVLDSQQIRALNKRSIAGLLKTLPGLLVEEQGGAGGLTAVSIRGAETNFTLVLVDGVPVNDPTNSRGGSFDFANLNATFVERIEVVRGAQSAIYGSDALAGVINIITRRPEEGHSQAVFAQWGEEDFSDIGVSALGVLGNVDYTLELSRRDDGEPVEGSERDSDSANLRLGWQASDDHRLAASYRYLDGNRTSFPEQSGGPEYAVSGELDRSDYEEQVLALSWHARIRNNWQSVLRASHLEHDEVYTSPGISPYLEVPPNAADTEFERSQLRWVNTLELAPSYQLSLGADYRDEQGQSRGYLEYFGTQLPTDFELDRSTSGLFLSATATPSDDLLIQGSARHDAPDEFDNETSFSLGASYRLGSGFSLAANWGEAFKLPSFFALGHALVGNPELEPELATSWDVGLAWNVNDLVRFETTYFFNDYEDLVDFDNEEFRNVNRKNVETSGLEIQAHWRPFTEISLQAQVTYTDLDVKGEDTVLTGRPQWVAGLVAQWRFAPGWDTALDYQYTGEQWAASRHTGVEVTEELEDFHRVDWVLRYRHSDTWQIQMSADNLLDENYQTAVGFPAPGRLFRLGLLFSH